MNDYDRDRENWADAEAQEAEDRAQYEIDVAQHMRERENAEPRRDAAKITNVGPNGDTLYLIPPGIEPPPTKEPTT